MIERREDVLDPLAAVPPWIVEIIERAGHVTARYITDTKEDAEYLRTQLMGRDDSREIVMRLATEAEAELESVHVHSVTRDTTVDSLTTVTSELTVRVGNRLVECKVTLRQNPARARGEHVARSFDIWGTREKWASPSLIAALAEAEAINEDYDYRPIADAIAAAVDESARAWGLDD